MNKPSQQISRLRDSFDLFREPTMEEMLSDPIVKAVMTADNVDPVALERRLRSVALMLRSRAHADRSAWKFNRAVGG
jgi:hypothetical protein